MLGLRTVLATATLIVAPAAAAQAADAVARMMTSDGGEVGAVEFTATASGTVLIAIELIRLDPGAHAIHIHETGACDSPGFESAGGHLALGHDHGVMAANGPHPGDLPNLHVGNDGHASVEYFNDRISLEEGAENSLFDADGAAVIVHMGADDYASQPAGDAGDRFACGVIERK